MQKYDLQSWKFHNTIAIFVAQTIQSIQEHETIPKTAPTQTFRDSEQLQAGVDLQVTTQNL